MASTRDMMGWSSISDDRRVTGNRAADLVWAFGSLILVGSALLARRLPAARLGKMALAWIVIFVVAVTIVVLWQRLTAPPAVPRDQPPSRPDQLVVLHNVYYRTG